MLVSLPNTRHLSATHQCVWNLISGYSSKTKGFVVLTFGEPRMHKGVVLLSSPDPQIVVRSPWTSASVPGHHLAFHHGDIYRVPQGWPKFTEYGTTLYFLRNFQAVQIRKLWCVSLCRSHAAANLPHLCAFLWEILWQQELQEQVTFLSILEQVVLFACEWYTLELDQDS